MLDDDEAIEAWNTRPLEDALRAELEFAKNDLATRLTELAAAQAENERLQKEMDAIVSLDELMVDKCQQIKAENERLKGIIREAEFSTDLQTSVDSFVAICPICSAEYSWGHNNDCPFYQWEGGAQ